MLAEIHTTDPTYSIPSDLGFLRRLSRRFLLDDRDYPFFQLTLILAVIFIPSALLLFINKVPNPWIYIPYLGFGFIYFLGPYTLMLHNLCHRKVFKKNGQWIELLIVWILGPLFGQTPRSYYAHHIGMHHVENNEKNDLSSTMKYQRDSFLHFSKYLLIFLIGVIPTLGIYLWKNRRFKILKQMFLGELGYLMFIGTLLFINWSASIIVLMIPMLVVRFAMMAGNWAQHAFIDSQNPGNIYRNSITCINSSYNKRCFNDGYHIGHHLRMNRHWTEMPKEFNENLKSYYEEKAIVFEKLDYFMIWVLLMLRKHERLSQHMVDLGPRKSMSQRILSTVL